MEITVPAKTRVNEFEMERQLEREERRFKIFQQLSDRHRQQTEYLEASLQEIMIQYQQREEQRELIIMDLARLLDEREHEISKYRTVFIGIYVVRTHAYE